MELKAICVYCGSSAGVNETYAEGARALGRMLAEHRITLVYGGASVGLMGQVADAAMESGGRVIGVIPRALAEREVAHHALSQLHIVDSMHERKAMMAELSDGFVALPGGIGTFEELFEIWTWGQLGIHAKPCGVLNIAGFYDPLIDFLDRAVLEGFIKADVRRLLHVAISPLELLESFYRYQPASIQHRMRPEET